MRPLPLADVQPPGSDDEALERVRQQVSRVKRRRAAGGAAAAAAVLIIVGIATAVAIRSSGDRHLEVTAGGGATTTRPDSTLPSTTVPAVTTSPAPSSTDLAAVHWDTVAYPIDCGPNFGTKLLKVVIAVPDPAHRVAVVLAACNAGAGSPPRSVFVYDRADSPTAPHLRQLLTRDDQLRRLTGTLTADGASVTTTGGTYSSGKIPRCCPDGTFTAHWTWNGQDYAPN